MNTDLIKQRFSKAQHTYSQNSSMQDIAAYRLAELIFARSIPPKKILEIGAGTGRLTQTIRDKYPSTHYLANDIVESLSDRYLQMGCESLMGDITKLVLPQEIDLVASSSCFQWIEELDAFVDTLYGKISTGGVLAFSSFGTGHFSQLKELNGHGLHYHPSETVRKFMKKAGFSDVLIEEQSDTLYFATALDMLKYFSATGVNAIHREIWTPNKLILFEQRYRDRFPSEGGLLPLDVHYLWVLGDKK